MWFIVQGLTHPSHILNEISNSISRGCRACGSICVYTGIMECSKTGFVVFLSLIMMTAGFVLTIAGWFAPAIKEAVMRVRIAGPATFFVGLGLLLFSCVMCAYQQRRCFVCCYRFSNKKKKKKKRHRHNCNHDHAHKGMNHSDHHGYNNLQNDHEPDQNIYHAAHANRLYHPGEEPGMHPGQLNICNLDSASGMYDPEEGMYIVQQEDGFPSENKQSFQDYNCVDSPNSPLLLREMREALAQCDQMAMHMSSPDQAHDKHVTTMAHDVTQITFLEDKIDLQSEDESNVDEEKLNSPSDITPPPSPYVRTSMTIERSHSIDRCKCAKNSPALSIKRPRPLQQQQTIILPKPGYYLAYHRELDLKFPPKSTLSNVKHKPLRNSPSPPTYGDVMRSSRV